MNSTNSQENSFLNIARGIAALAVALGHLRNLLFVDSSEIVGHPGVLVKALYFFSGFGHLAVIVFFVLSGYLIGGSVVKALRAGRWSASAYTITRLSRLLTVLIPALVVGAILDAVGMSLFGVAGTYSGNPAWGNVIPVAAFDRSTLAIYFGNAMFLQNVLVPTAGTNSALWSLSNEFSYYFLFMFGVMFLHSAGSRLRKTAAVIAAVALSYLYREQISSGFHIWLFGLVVLFIEAGISKASASWLKYFVAMGGVAGFVFLILARLKYVMSDDTVNGTAVAGVILAGTMIRFPLRKFSAWISESSYTLYATHLPLVAFLCAWQTTAGRLQPTTENLVKFFLFVVMVLAWSRLLYHLTERHTAKVRNYGMHLLSRIPRLAV